MEILNNINTEDKKIRDILWAVPDSYEDFVNSTADCMEQDDGLKKVIMGMLKTNPESKSSDILKVVCNFYGFNKPLEIVDDDEDEEMFVGASSRSFARAAY